MQITLSCKSVCMHLFIYSTATFRTAMTEFTWHMKSTCYLQNQRFSYKLSATKGIILHVDYALRTQRKQICKQDQVDEALS